MRRAAEPCYVRSASESGAAAGQCQASGRAGLKEPILAGIMSYPPGHPSRPRPEDGASNPHPHRPPQGRRPRDPLAAGPSFDDDVPRRRPLWQSAVAVVAIVALVLTGVATALSFLAA